MSPSKACTVWFTGLPCSGKSTLARLLIQRLEAQGLPAQLLDGDEIRRNLSAGLGFSKEDRLENARRIAFVAGLLVRHGVFVVVAAVSPYRVGRDEARNALGRFVEVHVDCPVEVCQVRDVKGLYAKAREGLVQGFTGVSAPYEIPENADLVLRTDLEAREACAERVWATLERQGYVDPGG